jgi:hypothetical protein
MDTFPMPVDMGAMWIHGITANPVYALAQKYGVQTMCVLASCAAALFC